MRCEHLSPSRTDLYEQCPKRYQARYEKKLYGTTTHKLETGNLVHYTAEIYYDPDFEGSLEDAFEMAKDRHNCRDLAEYREVRKILQRMENTVPKKSLVILDTEWEFDHIFPNGLNILGKIDVVEQYDSKTIRIWDFKSGSYIPSFEDLIKAHQTNMYPAYIYTADEFKHVDHVIFRYFYIREGIIKDIDVYRDDMDNYLEYLAFIQDQILREQHPPETINTFCWNCPFRHECTEYNNLVKTNFEPGDIDKMFGQLEDPKDVEKLAERCSKIGTAMTCLKKEKDSLNSQLVSATAENFDGVFESSKYRVKTTSKSTTYYDKATVLKLAKTDRVRRMLFKVDSRAVDDYFGSDDEALAKIRETSKVYNSNPFVRITKIKDR